MLNYCIDVNPGTSTYMPIAAGFTTLIEKEIPIVFSGTYLNGSSGFSEIIGRRSSLVFKGVVLESDRANAFIYSCRRASGLRSKSKIIYFSEEDLLPSGEYKAVCRTVVIKVDKVEKRGTDDWFEGELILCDDFSAYRYMPA